MILWFHRSQCYTARERYTIAIRTVRSTDGSSRGRPLSLRHELGSRRYRIRRAPDRDDGLRLSRVTSRPFVTRHRTRDDLASVSERIIRSTRVVATRGLLRWRRTASRSIELQESREISEAAETRASKISGALLFALALYVVVSALWSLCTIAARIAHYLDRSSLFRRCTFSRKQNFVSPPPSKAERYEQMPLRLSPAVACHSSSLSA